jgi:tetratricopeptide (TPR) repeat protein
VQQGFAALQRGDFPAAERAARTALDAAPGLAPALNLLAIGLHLQARDAEAAPLFAELTRHEPGSLQHWTNLGTSLRALGRLDESLRAYEQAARLGASDADYFYNVGLLRIDRGEYEAARSALGRARSAAPGDLEIAYHFAAACAESLDTSEGLAALAGWEGHPGLTPEFAAKIGSLLMVLGDLAGASRAFDRALEDPTPGAVTLVQLALGLERANRIAEANRALERLRAHPERARAGEDALLAEARLAQRGERHGEAVRLYGKLIDACPEPERCHFHQFPLARSLDALGRHEPAMATLVAAHRSQVAWIRRTQPEVAERKRETMRVTRFGCDPADAAGWDHSGAPDMLASPVFIVAFPRSGTTLLEHALDAHPRLRTMDEQPYLQNAIEHLAGPGIRYPDRMAALTAAQLRAARDDYWRRVRANVVLGPGEQLIDKNPLNILRLPAIVRLFPHARIVLAIRHPYDVLLSCFMQHFRAEFAWQCRDLETLAVAYRRTFDFWYQQATILRPPVHEVRYETLVTEFEPQVRALADFLELPWTDAMLAPGENARRRGFISAPSYSQVVQPVHGRSIGRWQPYRRWLSVMRPQLDPYFDRWGYACAGSEEQVGR